MQQITLRLPEATREAVEEAAEEWGVSRSEYIREFLTDGVSHDEHAALQAEHDELRADHERLQREHERLQERLEALEGDLERAEARAEDLRRQLREANARNDDVDELVRVVEAERSLAERKARAGALTRLKWWVGGMEEDRAADGRKTG